MICTGCGKRMREHGVTRDQDPGTVPRGRGDTCQTCTKHRGPITPAPVVDDSACVLIRVNLRPSTYRTFALHGRELGVEVGELLSRLADRAVRPIDQPRARRRGASGEDAIDKRIRELNAQRLSDNRIAAMIGMAQSAISKRRRRLGLEPPVPRSGGRQKAST